MEEEENSAYPIDPEQLEPQQDETDEKYDRAMSILKGMIEMGDSGFSSSSVTPPVEAPTVADMSQPDSTGLTMPALPMMPQSPVQLGGKSSLPDPLMRALQQQQQQQQQLEEEVEESADMESPGQLEQKYMEALAQAQAQERLNAQENALSDRITKQHEAAVARAKYDLQMVDYLKNMTAQWEKQANASEAAANRTEEMMMEINGAQVARAKLEKAAQEEINAQREHAMRTAEVKRYEEALTQLKEMEVNATSRKENASATLEEAFELFQKNSNQTASAAIAKAGTADDVLSQLGGDVSSAPMMTLPPGISPPGVESSSSSSSNSSPQPLFAKLVPPPLGNVVMGSSSTDNAQEGGISNPGAAVKSAMESAGFPMLDTSEALAEEEDQGE